MKSLRIICTILSIIWMISVFCFSHQPSDESKNTSSFITEKIVTIFYGNSLSEEEIEVMIQELDPIIRKLAHYTLYMIGGILVASAMVTYNIMLKNKIILTQIICTVYAILDEIHQYFIPR